MLKIQDFITLYIKSDPFINLKNEKFFHRIAMEIISWQNLLSKQKMIVRNIIEKIFFMKRPLAHFFIYQPSKQLNCDTADFI